VLEESDGQLSLKIAGPGGIKAALNESIAALRLRRDVGASKWQRWAKSGAAVAIVLLVVCELPLLLVVLSLGGAAMSVERQRRGCALG
jgi:hypothetical protein